MHEAWSCEISILVPTVVSSSDRPHFKALTAASSHRATKAGVANTARLPLLQEYSRGRVACAGVSNLGRRCGIPACCNGERDDMVAERYVGIHLVIVQHNIGQRWVGAEGCAIIGPGTSSQLRCHFQTQSAWQLPRPRPCTPFLSTSSRPRPPWAQPPQMASTQRQALSTQPIAS